MNGIKLFYKNMLLVIFFLICSLFADESLIPTLENDPSVLIEGKVNALTGRPCLSEEDLVIQGAEPIRISRSYAAVKNGYWRIAQTLVSIVQRKEKYRWVFWEQGYPIIYKEEGTAKIDGKIFLRYVSSNLNEGFSNTYRGEISSRTNLKNNYFLADEEFRYVTVHAADGTIRRYKKSGTHQSEDQKNWIYRLLSEKLPNGNWVLYDYEIATNHGEEHYNLTSIRTTNPAQNKTYAQAIFHYEDPKRKNKHFWIEGSDGQKVEYFFQKDAKTGRQSGSLVQVVSSGHPDQFFDYLDYESAESDIEFPGEWKIRHQLGSCAFPLERRTEFSYYRYPEETVLDQKIKMQDQYIPVPGEGGRTIGYYSLPDWRRDRVKTISAPVGIDSHLEVTHSLIYEKGKTSVYDAERNRTDYFFDDTWHLKKIERISKEGLLQNAEHFVWNACNLVEKRILDAHSRLMFFKHLIYDGRGNVLEERISGDLSGAGNVETYVKRFRYSSGEPNLLLEESEDNGKRVVYEYLPGTDLILSRKTYDRDQLKLNVSFEYNEDHILVREIFDDGVFQSIREITPYSSGPYLNMPWIIEEKGVKKIVITYTTGGRIAQKDVFDAEGKFRYSLQTTYDEKGRPLTQSNPLGQIERYTYDACGNKITSQDVSGRLNTQIDYDFCDRPIRVRKEGNDGTSLVSQYLYDRRNHLCTEIDPRGHSITRTYDCLGRCIETRLPAVALETGILASPTVQSSYDSVGNEICNIDAEGAKKQTTYNAYGKPVQIIHPDGSRETNRYFLDGSLQTHIDPCGVITAYTWDILGHLIQKKIYSKTGAVLAEEHFVYQGNHLIEKVDAEGNRTVYRYDSLGRLIAEEFDGVKTCYTHDALGRICRVQTGALCTLIEFDLLDRVIEERKLDSSTGELLRWTRTSYDEAGNPCEMVHFSGEKEVREERKYDSLNRLIWKKDPLGAIETIDYEDQPVSRKIYKDPLGLTIIETFDAYQRPVRIEKNNGKLLSLEEKSYTLNGSLSSQKDTIFAPDGSSRKVLTRWRYDLRGKLIELIEADDKRTRYDYTPRGELAHITKPDGTILTYEYNELGHLIALTSSDGTVAHRMSYNRLGHLFQSDAIHKVINARGLVLKEGELEFSYDQLGRKTNFRIPQADCLIEYEYNACDLKRISRKNCSGKTLYTHEYNKYDLSGNLSEEQLIGGLGRRSNSFDLCSRKQKIIAPSFSQEVLNFDQVGNIRKMRVQGDESVYSYDELYQMSSEFGLFTHEYSYDSMYNRLQKDDEVYQVNDLHQLISHWKYDLNGNPIEKGDTRYTYDALNRLIRVETPEWIKTYTYDFENRCLSSTIDRQGAQKTCYFLYDGRNEIGVLDETQQVQELRILGETPHAELGSAVALEMDGVVYAPIHDLQGNVAVLLRTDGSVAAEYRYSAFGEEKVIGIKSLWRFSSKRSDEDTGFIFFGRRFYSPECGRWLTPDPAGFTDGMNLYAFVHNDPLTHFDAYGLIEFELVEENLEKQRYLSGAYQFKDYYHYYVPPSWKESQTQKPRGEIFYSCGIMNTREDFLKSLVYLSRLAGDVPVHGVHMPSFGLFEDIQTCSDTLRSGMNSTVLHIEQYYREASERVGEQGKIFTVLHSGGAINGHFAGMKLPEGMRSKCEINAFAPGKILSSEWFSNVQNYASTNQDLVMRIHEWGHPKEYKEALQSGLLIRLPAHPEASKFNDHSIMTPTFKIKLEEELQGFKKNHHCR